MSIDVSQFHQVFFEESFEGLDVMEAGLLDIGESDDSEIINAIFRAAHSIKGGAGTFGFNDVSGFTHSIETLLDEVRNGQRHLSGELTNLLLVSVDVLREMLIAVQSNGDLDHARINEVNRQLQSALEAGSEGVSEVSPGTETSQPKVSGWQISFRPHSHMLQTGNDPVRMFRELAALGDLSVTVSSKALPAFADLEPEDSYLQWQLVLMGAISREEIDEVFDWVEGGL